MRNFLVTGATGNLGGAALRCASCRHIPDRTPTHWSEVLPKPMHSVIRGSIRESATTRIARVCGPRSGASTDCCSYRARRSIRMSE